MNKFRAFSRETLDMTLVYLALVGVALPIVILLRFIPDNRVFLLAVVLVGTALALFLLPVMERKIRVFAARDGISSWERSTHRDAARSVSH